MLDENTTAYVSSDSQPSVVYENHTCIIFDGFKGANVSFLNSVSSHIEPAEDIMPLNEEEGAKLCKQSGCIVYVYFFFV